MRALSGADRRIRAWRALAVLVLVLVCAPHVGARADTPPAPTTAPVANDAVQANIDTPDTPKARVPRPPIPGGIGLVLSGGGARGAAHIGVLKVIERERVPIAYIAGTSMGAVVGGLYAAGYSPDEIEAVMSKVDWKDMFVDDPSRLDLPMRRKNDDLRFLLGFDLGFRDGRIQLPRGAIQGQKLLLLLRRLLLPAWRIDDFDDLPIPFRCVGTDIGRGEPVVFDHGDLALAMRASMSVPAAFAPIRVDGKLMVDGGIVNNVPYDVVKAMGAQRVIVVNVGEPLLPESALNSPVAITLQMISALMEQRTREVLRDMSPDDLLIVPDLADIASTQFERTPEAIRLGEQGALAIAAQLQRFSASPEDYARFQERQKQLPYDPPLVQFLEVASNRSRTAGYVQQQLAHNVGKPLDPAQIEQQIGYAYGYGKYERINWQVVDENGRTGIAVTPVDKGWGPNFITFGLQLSDDFNGRNSYQLVGEGTFSGFDDRGAEWRNRVSLGAETGLYSEYYQPFGELAHYFLQPSVEVESTDLPIRVDGSLLGEYRLRRAQAGFEVGWTPSSILELSTGIVRGQDQASLQIGSPDLFERRVTRNFGGLVLRGTRDTLDQAAFPSRGSRTEVDITVLRDALGSDSSDEVVSVTWDRAWSHGRDRWLIGARGQTTWGEANVFQSTTFLGGFTNLSGFGERELFGGHSALLRGVYFRRLGSDTRLFSVPAYVGASLETGNVWVTRDDIGFDSLIYAGSVFVGIEGPFGPIFLGYGHADTGDSSWYLNFGSLLRPRL
jgi:NTE family protein